MTKKNNAPGKETLLPRSVCDVLQELTVAAKKSRKKKKIKFELTLGGLLGVGAVLFCIFLWMFLFGLWAGQTILLPAG